MTKTASTQLNSPRRRDDARAATTISAAAASSPEQTHIKPWEVSPPELPLWRAPELYAQTGLSQSTLYEMVRAGTFPPPIKIGPRVVAWPSNHVTAWLASRVEPAAMATSATTLKQSRPAGREKARPRRASVV
jgi:predicted DNA-binding transcriptional regulator AlpA